MNWRGVSLYFRKHPILSSGGLVVLGLIGGVIYYKRAARLSGDLVEVKRGDVVFDVSMTGKVKPAKDVALAFEKSGRLAAVPAIVGNRVVPGELLASLENGDLRSRFHEQEAVLASSQAKLEERERGTRREELEVEAVKVKNAEVALEDARRNLVDKIREAYTQSDDAIRSKADQFFTNPRTSNPAVNFAADSQMRIDLEGGRLGLEQILSSWDAPARALTTSSDLVANAAATRTNLLRVKSFLDTAALAINALIPTSGLTQTTIDTYRSNIATARSNINIATSNLSAAEEKLRTQESAFFLARQEYVLKNAGATPEELKESRADVERARALVEASRAELAKTEIRAPIAGIVTKVDAKVGEIAPPNTPLVSLISDSQFEIEANMPEADVAHVKIGDTARVTLDAYGDVPFEARVVKVDPAETLIEGVTTYKATLLFAKKDDRVKSGMTANVTVHSQKHEGVLYIPQQAVYRKGADSYVRLVESDGVEREMKVEPGLQGSNGLVEIREGLRERDRVVAVAK